MYNAGHRVASELALGLAPDVMVHLRGRRLGDTDGIGSRKGLLQPLLQRLVEPALLAVVDLFGLRAWCGHETTSSWHAVLPRRLADGPTMLDDCQAGKYKKAIMEGAGNVHEAHHLYRRPASGSQAKGAEGIFRLCRPRLLFRGDVARQSRRPAADQVSPAHPGRCVETRSLH